MSIYKVTETQTETGAWAADTSVQTDLLRNGPITRIYATAEVTPSATLGGANQPGGLFRVLSGITIGAGGQTYFTIPTDDGGVGGILMHYLNAYDGFGVGHTNGVITAPARTYSPITFVFHAGSRPKTPFGNDNPYDLSAFIPASKTGRLTAIWDTDGNDVMDDTVTISSGTFRYTLCQVLPNSEAELRAEMAAQGISVAMQPLWENERYAIAATATAYSDRRNIPVGNWVKRIVVACQDATADRPVLAQDEVTGISIELPREGRYLYRAFVDKDMAQLPSGTFLIADAVANVEGGATRGVFKVDLREHTTYLNPLGKDYGIDARGMGRGDLLLGLTVTTNASGDDALILYEQFKEIAGPLL